MKHLLISLIAIGMLLISCKKKDISPLDQLPPATQTGANTFGCLVNGKAWTPYKDCFLCSPSLKFYYDNSNGGQFSIQADNDNLKNSIVLTMDSCTTVRKINFKKNSRLITSLFLNRDINNHYSISSLDTDVDCTGFIEITKYDLVNSIISGTFNFILTKNGFITLTLTEGRFDAKL